MLKAVEKTLGQIIFRAFQKKMKFVCNNREVTLHICFLLVYFFFDLLRLEDEHNVNNANQGDRKLSVSFS